MYSEYYKVRYIWELIRGIKDVVEILQSKISLCYVIMSFKHKNAMLFNLFQIFLKTASQFLNAGHKIMRLVNQFYVLLCTNILCYILRGKFGLNFYNFLLS